MVLRGDSRLRGLCGLRGLSCLTILVGVGDIIVA